MKEPLCKEECELILPFSNVLNEKVKNGTVTKNDFITFISLVKEILKEPQNETTK